jgi:hypothetical protein
MFKYTVRLVAVNVALLDVELGKIAYTTECAPF